MPTATTENAPGNGGQADCHRFFFALKPDPQMAAQTHDFARARVGPKGLVTAARLHVTLALTEDAETVDAALIAALRRAGDAVSAFAFTLHLDRLVAARHLVLLCPTAPPPTLKALQSAISAEMTAQGVAMRADWRFDPHATLAYRKGEASEAMIEGFRWDVSAFMLVHSHVGLTRHETIGSWPLRPAGTSD